MEIPVPDSSPLQPELAPAVVQALAKAEQLNDQALAFVRAHPVPCIVGAVALGFVVGKIAARY